MEGKNKRNGNQISTVLMIVGVIFIMIAGSIFVTTAWKHLSEMGKRMILTGVVVALYTVSWKLRSKGILAKTEHALYYLATAGTGFLAVSFLGGWNTYNGHLSDYSYVGVFNNADKAIWGLMAVSVGIAYRYFREKKVWDFSILSYIFINVFLLVFEAKIDDLAGIIPLVGLILLATSKYLDTKKIGYRIAQSIGIIITNIYLVYELCDHFGKVWNFENEIWWGYMVLIIPVVLMVVFKRAEFLWSAVAINWINVLIQLFAGIDEWDEGSKLYNVVPFAATMVIAFVIMWYKDNDKKYKKLAIIHGLMAATELITFGLAKTLWYQNLYWNILYYAAMSMCIMIAFIFAMVDSVLENDLAGRIIRTITLLFAVCASFFLSPIVAPEDFEVEFMSIFFGAGIVLLGRIWYDRVNGIRMVQFVLTCITLAVLLIHNIEVEELSNLMFLGISGIVMLIVAAVKNHKEYVIASSTVLALLALYLTRAFWLSIAWWVYLFVAGVVLVAIAIKKEKDVLKEK